MERSARALVERSHPPATGYLKPNAVATLDLLRALAANLVLVSHIQNNPRYFNLRIDVTGSLGVTTFFVLSGFLILQSSLLRVKRGTGNLTDFMIDRIARIFTPYVPALVIIALLNAFVDLGDWSPPIGTNTGPVAFIGNLFLLQQYPLFQIGLRTVGGKLYIWSYKTADPFWTIPIEFWTYVAFGLVFFVLLRGEKVSRGWAIAAAVIATPVVIWNAAVGSGNGLCTQWLLGAVAGYVWATAWYAHADKRSIGLLAVLAASFCILIRGAKIGWSFQDIGLDVFLALALLGLLSLAQSTSEMPSALRKLCTGVAAYSYSLYLVHNTVLIAVWRLAPDLPLAQRVPLAFTAAHAVAFGLYWCFERHYRRVGAWLRHAKGTAGRPAQAPAGAVNVP